MRLDYNYYISEIKVKDVFNSVQFTEKFSYVNRLMFYYKSLSVNLKYFLNKNNFRIFNINISFIEFFNCNQVLGNSYPNPCPEKAFKCPVNKTKRTIYLLNDPNYYAFSLSWKEMNPKLTQICNLFLMTTHFFMNKDIYEIFET